MLKIKWPVALATMFLVLLGWYLVYTESIVRALEDNAERLSEIYHEVQAGLATMDQSAAITAMFNLQGIIIESGVPLVITGPGGLATAFENLDFEVDLDSPEGQREILAYTRSLDAAHPPVGDPNVQQIHFGSTPEFESLRRIPWFQAGGMLLTALIGFVVIRSQRRAVAERPGGLRDREIAGSIGEDLQRLEGISHRFELIGTEPELESLSVRQVVSDLEQYLASRIPKLSRKSVELVVDIPPGLPRVQGNEVLLIWALENVVKNALDALAGRGGKITIYAREIGGKWISLRIRDTGPGVDPEIRDKLFEPGVTTKSSGWGVGLALSRRIVEGVHKGRIELLEGFEGTTFQIRLPAADA